MGGWGVKNGFELGLIGFVLGLNWLWLGLFWVWGGAEGLKMALFWVWIGFVWVCFSSQSRFTVQKGHKLGLFCIIKFKMVDMANWANWLTWLRLVSEKSSAGAFVSCVRRIFSHRAHPPTPRLHRAGREHREYSVSKVYSVCLLLDAIWFKEKTQQLVSSLFD